jgi:magnesium transporter
MTLESQESTNLMETLRPEIVEALKMHNVEDIRLLFLPLHAADAAELLSSLDIENQKGVLEALADDLNAEILAYLEDPVRENILKLLDREDLAILLPELASDDAVEVIEQLDEDKQKEVLAAIPARDRALLEQSLTYHEKSAGRLMQREMVTVLPQWTVGQVIDIFHLNVDLPEIFHSVFVVDPQHRPIGMVPLAKLLRNKRNVLIEDIMEEKKFIKINDEMDQEDIAHIFRKYGLVSVPVINQTGILVGVIMVDDIVDVIEEEAEQDMFYLSGMSSQDLSSAVLQTVKLRLPWLLVNLGAAFISAYVISLFRGTLDKMINLAVIMAIAPSLATNAGTQTLTVIIRAFAMGKIRDYKHLLNKETLVGFLNGLLLALLTMIISVVWFKDITLGLVIGLAMVVNIVVACFVGVLIPVFLKRTPIDPALASSVFLTTITDAVGFFIFLGLASLILI